MSDGLILSVDRWPSNGHLIADVDRLGLIPSGPIFDATFGRGTFWTEARRLDVVSNDLRTPSTYSIDWTKPIGRDAGLLGSFDTVVFDPPYKLNGTPTDDDRYGVDEKVSVKERKRRCRVGLYNLRPLLAPGGTFLSKTQNQIANGRYHDLVGEQVAIGRGLGLHVEAMFHFLIDARPQRSQVRARNNYSTLIVFVEKGIE